MNLRYMGCHLDIFGIAHLHEKKKRYEIKKVCSQPILIFFVSKGVVEFG